MASIAPALRVHHRALRHTRGVALQYYREGQREGVAMTLPPVGANTTGLGEAGSARDRDWLALRDDLFEAIDGEPHEGDKLVEEASGRTWLVTRREEARAWRDNDTHGVELLLFTVETAPDEPSGSLV